MRRRILAIWVISAGLLWWFDWMGYNRTLVLVGNVALTVFVLYQLAHLKERNGELK